KGDRLWMISVFATEVRDSAMMKAVEAMAKHVAMASPGQPASRTTPASRPRWVTITAPDRKAAQKTERQKMVVHGSVPASLAMSPPLLQQSAAAVTSPTPRRRLIPHA